MIRVSSSSYTRRRLASFTVAFGITFLLLIIGIYTDHVFMELGPFLSEGNSSTASKDNSTHFLSHRKLLNDGAGAGAGAAVEPNRIWSEKCSKSDIVVSQGATETLPNGIPTYTVEITNMCVSGCDISRIHLSCGWFSSARLVNPHVFKRLLFNDCLVNNGKPLLNGRTLSFQYANTFRYPLSVSSLTC